jgi:prepilin-type N-terminal cleavage/methylation domain-containing protein
MKKQNKKGFTIIEVLFVLVIAGIIMLIVFVAIPQLRKQTRNTQMKDVMSRISAELENYSTQANGSYPGDNTSFGNFKVNYIEKQQKQFKDPLSDSIVAIVQSSVTSDLVDFDSDPRNVLYMKGKKCTSDGQNVENGTSRSYALVTHLNDNVPYCLDNQ